MKAKVIFSLIVLMNLEFVHSQFSATGGTSLFNNFGTGRNLFGLDLGLEYNQDENESIWGRISFYPSIKNSRIDSLFLEPYDINKFSKTAYVQTRTGFLQLSGGSRYHAGDGYDMGIGLFGGFTRCTRRRLWRIAVGACTLNWPELLPALLLQ